MKKWNISYPSYCKCDACKERMEQESREELFEILKNSAKQQRENPVQLRDPKDMDIDWVNLIPGELIHPLAMKSFVEAHKNR